MSDNNSKTSLWGNLIGGSRRKEIEEENARLEAFVSALPGAYCGWGEDGTIAYNKQFCNILNIPSVDNFHDVEDALPVDDARRLRTAYNKLVNDNEAFDIQVRNIENIKTFRVRGQRGQSTDGSLRVNLLWFEDITNLNATVKALEKNKATAEEEQERLQLALDKIQLPVWMRSTTGEIIWCNQAYADLLETTRASVIAEQVEFPLKSAKKSEGKNPVQKLAEKAKESGQPEELVTHIILHGKRRLMKITETPFVALDLSMGVAMDMTEVEELEERQKRYLSAQKELLEQMGSAISIFDANQKLEFYNSSFSQLWSLEEKYLNTKPKLGDVMEKLRENRRLPEQADFRKFKKTWLNMFTDLMDAHEDMLYLPDGSALRMLVVPHPLGGLMMTFEDVTSRLELESSYNTLIAVQKETLDNLAEGVVVFGGDGRVKLWNPAFAGLWGLNPEDLEGDLHVSQLADKMKKKFVAEDWPEEKKKILTQCLDRTEQEGHLALDDDRVINYSTVPLPDGGVLITHVDVTDTLQVENALREKNAALETAEQLKLDFLANVSYQLRTPLNAIMGFTEILSNEYFGPLNDRQKDYTASMTEAGTRLLSLIDDILDLSTIEAGYMELNYEEVDLKEALENIADLTREWARKQKVEVVLDYKDKIDTLTVDGRRLKQMLLNLVRNAIVFTPEGGKITLGARKKKQTVQIYVQDTGPGISEEDQRRIFETFERSGAAATDGDPDYKGRGAGLGLSLVKNIAELHKGTVGIESVVGEGATFTITLPIKGAKKAA